MTGNHFCGAFAAMVRNDRSERNPHLGAYGVLLAIVLCTIIAGVLSFSSGRESERRNNAPASYSSAAKQDAERACVGMEASTTFECVYEKVEASQEQARGEQDLSAQQRAASAAMISALIALLTLGATGLGVWYVKRTLDATLEAVKDTGEANEIAKNSLASSNRPILHLEIVDGERGTRRDAAIKNIGNGPAVIEKISFTRSYANVNEVPHYIAAIREKAAPLTDMAVVIGKDVPLLVSKLFGDHKFMASEEHLKRRKGLTPGSLHGFDPDCANGPYDMAFFRLAVEYRGVIGGGRYSAEWIAQMMADPMSLVPQRYDFEIMPHYTQMT